MDYPSLSLSRESIENAFAVKDKDTLRKQSSLKGKFSSGDVQKCEKCDYKTSKHEHMRQHMVIQHSGIKHKCTYCDYTHYFPNRVKTHENHIHKKIPRRKDPYTKCDECSYSTQRKSKLKKHTQAVHEGAVFTCEICNVSVKYLEEHTRRVHENVQRTFSCEQCQFSTKGKRDLGDHIRSAHAENP